MIYKLLCSLILVSLANFPALAAQGAPPTVSIQGKTFYKNGEPWLPKGLVVEGFNQPPSLRVHNKLAVEGRAFYGIPELQAIRAEFGGDVIHFKISQPGLDPESEIYDSSYAPELVDAIQLARTQKFIVILSMDAQVENGLPNLPCMPNDSTKRAWQTILPRIGSDQGIMLELFNEPCKSANPKNIKEWAEEHQALLESVRKSGSKNILLLNGLLFGRYTNGLFPLIQDTMRDHLSMSIHPYLFKGFTTVKDWQNYFGASAAKYPLIATEWNATPSNGCIDDTTPKLSLDLIRYLQDLHVGLIGWAIDSVHGPMAVDHLQYRPTDHLLFKGCGDHSLSGGGQLLARYPRN